MGKMAAAIRSPAARKARTESPAPLTAKACPNVENTGLNIVAPQLFDDLKVKMQQDTVDAPNAVQAKPWFFYMCNYVIVLGLLSAGYNGTLMYLNGQKFDYDGVVSKVVLIYSDFKDFGRTYFNEKYSDFTDFGRSYFHGFKLDQHFYNDAVSKVFEKYSESKDLGKDLAFKCHTMLAAALESEHFIHALALAACSIAVAFAAVKVFQKVRTV